MIKKNATFTYLLIILAFVLCAQPYKAQNPCAGHGQNCLAPYMQADYRINFTPADEFVSTATLEQCFDDNAVLNPQQSQQIASFLEKIHTNPQFAASALAQLAKQRIFLHSLQFNATSNSIGFVWNRDGEFLKLGLFVNDQLKPVAVFADKVPAWQFRQTRRILPSPVHYTPGDTHVNVPDDVLADDFAYFLNTQNIKTNRRDSVFSLPKLSRKQQNEVAKFCDQTIPALIHTDIVIDNIRQEFEHTAQIFANDMENTAMNTRIKTNILELLAKIRGNVLEGTTNPLKKVRRDLNDLPVNQQDSVDAFSIASLTGNPPTWGHVSVWLSGMLLNKTDKTVVISAGNRPDKPNTLHKDRRYAMIKIIQDKLWPLVEFSHNNETNDPNIKGTRARLVEINPHAKRIIYVAGDDHIEDLPRSLDTYTTRFGVNKDQIEVHFISRTKSLTQLENEVQQLAGKYPFRFHTTQTIFEGVSSSRFRKEKNASVPASVMQFLPRKANVYFLPSAGEKDAFTISAAAVNFQEKPIEAHIPGYMERAAEIFNAYVKGQYTLRMAFETDSLRQAA